jgi:hypothetical protein
MDKVLRLKAALVGYIDDEIGLDRFSHTAKLSSFSIPVQFIGAKVENVAVFILAAQKIFETTSP